MTRDRHTRRKILKATAGLIGVASTAGVGTGTGTSNADRGDQGDHDEHQSTEHVPGTVDRIHVDTEHEPGLMVVLTDDGREVCGSPDVYHIGEGDRVTARIRDGRLIGVSLREQETRERREEMGERFESLASETAGTDQ